MLFVGVNVVGGKVHDSDEWAQRHALCAAWIEAQVNRYQSEIQRLVILGHATPRGKHADFFDELERIAVGLNRPVLYIHGDGHTWERERLFDTGNRIRAARLRPCACTSPTTAMRRLYLIDVCPR